MSRSDDPEAVDAIVTRTGQYLQRVDTATEQMVRVIEAYREADAAVEAAVGEIQDIESSCDAAVGELRSLVGSAMDPNFTGLYLRSTALVSFYETADAVVNEAERFATELAAMEPTLPDEIAEGLLRMAEFAGEATVHLSRATTVQLENLTTPDHSADVSREVEQIRAVEGRCDDVKYRVLESAFASLPTGEALAVRALVNRLDAVTNAVEDAADRLVYLEHHGT